MFKKIFFVFLVVLLVDFYPAKVSWVWGKAYLIRKSRKKRIYSKKRIRTGDIVVTKKGGYVVLKGYDGSEIKIYENTKYIVTLGDRRKSNYQAKNMLLVGRVYYNLSKLKKIKKNNDYFKVYTPTSVSGVRGTQFEVNVNSSGDVAFFVKEGKVSAYNDIVNENNQLLEKQKIIKKNSGYYSDISGFQIKSKKELKKDKSRIKKTHDIDKKHIAYYYNISKKLNIKILNIYSNYSKTRKEMIKTGKEGNELYKTDKIKGMELIKKSQSLSLKTFNIFRNLINKINILKGSIVILGDIVKNQEKINKYKIFIFDINNKIEKDYKNY